MRNSPATQSKSARMALHHQVVWNTDKKPSPEPKPPVNKPANAVNKKANELAPTVNTCPTCGQSIRADRKTYMREYMRKHRAKPQNP